MIVFPVFAELEKKRDDVNAKFHRETEPVLMERVQQFGFRPSTPDGHQLVVKEQSTGNEYRLSFRPFEIRVEFCHVKTGKTEMICEISNFALSAHVIMDILIASIDSFLQYGVVYDYRKAQQFEVTMEKEIGPKNH